MIRLIKPEEYVYLYDTSVWLNDRRMLMSTHMFFSWQSSIFKGTNYNVGGIMLINELEKAFMKRV